MSNDKYSPDTHAAAATRRMATVLHLAEEVISGKVSPAAAKLSLMAGGYDDRVVDQIDALEVNPRAKVSPEDEAALQLGVDCVARLADARVLDEDIGQVLDRLMAGESVAAASGDEMRVKVGQ